MLELFALAIFLSFGPQIVLSLPPPRIFKFTVAPVEQCGPVTITYGGANLTAATVPVNLLILPFNSVPISIPIPDASVDSTGVHINFLPLAAGTNFLAALDDGTGTGRDFVSDIIRVLPSNTSDASCLPATPEVSPFQLADSVSQCEPFGVTFDAQDTTIKPPAVRAYFPSLFSLGLNATTDDSGNSTSSGNATVGRAMYTAALFRQLDVLLLFDDGQNHRSTSGLFSVGGDSSSPRACLDFATMNTGTNSTTTTFMATPKGAPTTGSIVGIVLGVTLTVGAIATGMLFWVVRRRQKRRGLFISEEPSRESKSARGSKWESFAGITPLPLWDEKNLSVENDPRLASFLDPSNPTYVKNPTYTQNSFDDSSVRDSIGSWSAHTMPQRISQASSGRSVIVQAHTRDSDVMSRDFALATADVHTPKTMQSSIFESQLTRIPSRGHLREPSNIPPATLSSATLSQLFPSPPAMTPQRSIDLSGSIVPGSVLPENVSLGNGDQARYSGGTLGLPTAPRRIVTKPSRERLISSDEATYLSSGRSSPRGNAQVPRDVTSWNSQQPSWYGQP